MKSPLLSSNQPYYFRPCARIFYQRKKELFSRIFTSVMSLVNEFLDDLEGISADRNQTCEDESMEIEECSTAKSLSKLQDSMLFQETMRKIDFYSTHQRKSSMEIEESIEGDPEYLLTVNVNNFSVEIDNEIDILHHFVRSIYRKPFPELEQLIPLPFDYLRTVQVRQIFFF